MNGAEYTNPEIAALLCHLDGTYGLKGDYLQRARELGYISKLDNHYYHAAKTYAREPSAVHLTSGKPSYVVRGSLSAPTVAGGGPTSDYKGCELAVNKAKDACWAAKGITGKGPASKNTVCAQCTMLHLAELCRAPSLLSFCCCLLYMCVADLLSFISFLFVVGYLLRRCELCTLKWQAPKTSPFGRPPERRRSRRVETRPSARSSTQWG